MRKFLKGLLTVAKNCCISFTLSVVIYTAVSACYGVFQISAAIVFELLALSVAGCVLQVLVFTNLVMKKMRYSLRMLLFFVPFLLILTGFAVAFEWFPMEYLSAWLMFFGIFVVFFILSTLVFELVFYAAGKKYNGLLGEYKKKKIGDGRQ